MAALQLLLLSLVVVVLLLQPLPMLLFRVPPPPLPAPLWCVVFVVDVDGGRGAVSSLALPKLPVWPQLWLVLPAASPPSWRHRHHGGVSVVFVVLCVAVVAAADVVSQLCRCRATVATVVLMLAAV